MLDIKSEEILRVIGDHSTIQINLVSKPFSSPDYWMSI